MSRCLSCEHLSMSLKPVETTGADYIGACVNPSRKLTGKTQLCRATEGFALLCREFEPAGANAVEQACNAEEGAL